MVEREKIDFQRVRTEAVLKAKRAGETDEAKLRMAADDAERQLKYKIGRESEKRFVNYVKNYPMVVNIRDVDHKEDIEDGIDFWIEFDDQAKLPDLPVQVKSSPKGVEEFKKDRRFEERRDLIIVVNCGSRVSLSEFYDQMSSELGRIRDVLKERKVHFI